MIGVVLGILFAIFVAIMFFDQLQCIVENTSTIDELKSKSGIEADERSYASQERTGWENIKEIFGDYNKPVNIWWLYPTDVDKKLIIEREFD